MSFVSEYFLPFSVVRFSTRILDILRFLISRHKSTDCKQVVYLASKDFY